MQGSGDREWRSSTNGSQQFENHSLVNYPYRATSKTDPSPNVNLFLLSWWKKHQNLRHNDPVS